MKTVRQLLQLKGKEIYSVTPEASVLDAVRMMSDSSRWIWSAMRRLRG